MTSGRKRKATAIGTMKYATRAWENAPPERRTRIVTAQTSTTVAASAKRDPTGWRYTSASAATDQTA